MKPPKPSKVVRQFAPHRTEQDNDLIRSRNAARGHLLSLANELYNCARTLDSTTSWEGEENTGKLQEIRENAAKIAMRAGEMNAYSNVVNRVVKMVDAEESQP